MGKRKVSQAGLDGPKSSATKSSSKLKSSSFSFSVLATSSSKPKPKPVEEPVLVKAVESIEKQTSEAVDKPAAYESEFISLKWEDQAADSDDDDEFEAPLSLSGAKAAPFQESDSDSDVEMTSSTGTATLTPMKVPANSFSSSSTANSTATAAVAATSSASAVSVAKANSRKSRRDKSKKSLLSGTGAKITKLLATPQSSSTANNESANQSDSMDASSTLNSLNSSVSSSMSSSTSFEPSESLHNLLTSGSGPADQAMCFRDSFAEPRKVERLEEPLSSSTSARNQVVFRIRLEANESLCFQGHVSLCVESGCVDVHGSRLQASSSAWTDLHSPFYLSTQAVLISAPSNDSSSSSSSSSSASASSAPSWAAVILLRACGSKLTQASLAGSVGKLISISQLCLPGFILVPAKSNVRALHFPRVWQNIASGLLDSATSSQFAPVVMLCGERNAGKSTFARFLVNQLLQRFERVAFLETDVGQTEFTPAGLVSWNVLLQPIVGPPSTHMLPPVFSSFFGVTTPSVDPQLYMACIRRCHSEFISQFSSSSSSSSNAKIPLIVNTHGWTKGLGRDLIAQIHDLIDPDWLLELQHTTSSLTSASAEAVEAVEAVESEFDDTPASEVAVDGNADEASAASNVETDADIEDDSLADLKSESESISSEFILSPAQLGRTRAVIVPRVNLSSSADGATSLSSPTQSTAPTASKHASSAPLLRAWALAAHLTGHVLSPWQLDDLPERDALDPSNLFSGSSSSTIVSATQRGLAAIPDLLASMRPYRVPISAVSVSFLHHEVSTDLQHVTAALNGSLVALCSTMGLTSSSSSSPLQLVSVNLQFPPRCLGLAVIRAIDAVAGCFYILTSVAPADLSAVNLLVKSPTSNLDLPSALTQLSHFSATASASSQPYFSTGSLPSAVADTASTRKNVGRKRL